MKTTIELPDDLAREAEARAALAGRSLPDLVAESLRLLLARPEPDPRPRGGAGDETRPHDITAWDRLRAAYQSPFPGLSAMEMLEEFRGPVDLPPTRP